MNPIDSVQETRLTVTADGTIRVGDSHVSLESVLYHFKMGAVPEEISQMFPSLQLADVYAVIAYYLSHREVVEDYLRQQEAAGDRVQTEIESRPGYQTAMREMREVLLMGGASAVIFSERIAMAGE